MGIGHGCTGSRHQGTATLVHAVRGRHRGVYHQKRRGGKEARRMEAIEERGLKINRKKTEYWSSSEQQDPVIRLEGEEVKRLKTFKYLVSTLVEDGECRSQP